MYSYCGHKDFATLLNMLDAINKIGTYIAPLRHADELFADNKTFDAVLMNFIVIGEMVDKLSDEFKSSTEEAVDWAKIKGFRNILAHDYFGVDAEEVWQIIHLHLPALQAQIQTYL